MPPILVVELAEMDLVGLLQPPKEEGRIRPQGPTCEGLACKRLRSQGAFDLFFIELAKLGPDLIADLPENRYDMLIAARGPGWISEPDMDSFTYSARENGTVPVGVVTDRDDIVKRLADKLTDAFGFSLRDIEPYFLHNANRVWIDPSSRLSTSRKNLQTRIERPQNPFSHLAASGITGAEDENSLLGTSLSLGSRDYREQQDRQ
jgi:hypothetical protein